MALIIGLTGGVASGKTQVSDTFAGLGAAVIDTDLLAREVVAIGSPALLELRSQCGDQCFRCSITGEVFNQHCRAGAPLKVDTSEMH